MKRWIITVREPYASAIMDGTKSVEVRTRVPKTLSLGDKIYICRKGSDGLLLGQVRVTDVQYGEPWACWMASGNKTGLPFSEFSDYCRMHKIIYMIHLEVIWDFRPIMEHSNYRFFWHVTDFGCPKAPQWFHLVK